MSFPKTWSLKLPYYYGTLLKELQADFHLPAHNDFFIQSFSFLGDVLDEMKEGRVLGVFDPTAHVFYPIQADQYMADMLGNVHATQRKQLLFQAHVTSDFFEFTDNMVGRLGLSDRDELVCGMLLLMQRLARETDQGKLVGVADKERAIIRPEWRFLFTRIKPFRPGDDVIAAASALIKKVQRPTL